MPNELVDITLLLQRAAENDLRAKSALVEALYDRVRSQAQGHMRGERSGHSWAASDLVHEALLRIWRSEEMAKAKNSHQLFRAYARAMRQVLIDHARRRNAEKRGGDLVREELDDLADEVRRQSSVDLMQLDEALNNLASELPREAAVLEMKFFGGNTLPEIANALDVSLSTVERDCRFALAWLRTHFARGG